MREILITLFVICFLTSCEKNETDTVQLTLSDFQSTLHINMSYNDIVEAFGEPENDIGSGIHIYVYTLSDSTKIWIGYADSILYVRHMDKEENVLNYLIGDSAGLLTYEYFKKSLKQGMDFNTIVNTFGEPVKDIGSGIHIYVYTLNDSTEIWIGYADSILYARHMDQNQNIIHTLY